MQTKFQRALDLEQRSPLSFERHCDAYFGLVRHISSFFAYQNAASALQFGMSQAARLQAEVLQNWAESVLAVCRTLPDAELTRDAEQTASSMAESLFKQAVESYQQVEALSCH